MSAFVVEKSIIDAIVTHIHGNFTGNHLKVYPGLKTLDPQKLGQSLWDMNAEAVDQRYSENNPRTIYRYGCEAMNQVERYKAMECFLYQCSEGDVPETPLYRDMERIKNELGADIISRLPEYEAASWH